MKKQTIYSTFAKNYEKDLLSNLKDFVKINSVFNEQTQDSLNPFGKGVSEALNFIYQLAKKDGFHVTNYDNKVVEILCGEGDKNITILAHADVVPPGSGWEHDPFEVVEKDGVFYGRGVADDKGPLLSSYYAMKMVRDHNLQGDYQIRFLIGGNEESGSLGIEHYFHTLKKEAPTLGFSPDSNFPLIYGEKGIVNFEVKTNLRIQGLVSIEGGVAANSVIERCVVKMKQQSDFIKQLDVNNINYEVVLDNDLMIVTFVGKSAHGSTPEEGINAGMIAVTQLADFYHDSTLSRISNLFSDLQGKGLKVDKVSEEMGYNSLNVGLIHFAGQDFQMVVNFRFVDGVSFDDLMKTIKENSKPLMINVTSISPLLYYPKDSVLVSTLLKAYQEETGDYISKPLTTGGGTYAKETTNVVAFGAEFPGWDSCMHSSHERIKKDDLIKCIAIYARSIVDLGKKIHEN